MPRGVVRLKVDFLNAKAGELIGLSDELAAECVKRGVADYHLDPGEEAPTPRPLVIPDWLREMTTPKLPDA